MEALPFADGSFSAVTSQFGFEYGDMAATSREVGRVLRAAGAAHFIIHHRSGPILAHNLPRREALGWAAFESDYLKKARALVAARTLASLPTPRIFHQAPTEARQRFPTEPVAAEFLAAVLQTLELGRMGKPAEALEVPGQLEKKASNELARIDALARAACDTSRMKQIVEALRAARLIVDEPSQLRETGRAAPFAWLLQIRKP